ncbi:hypothetical protein VNO78_15701 [Psophocarpus tetragonolobus]|uniref:Uncharacterized protein n=1 Tax=Psophocarpus tetragonolobus TaxID=3891 RepID=A0AAN9XK50_PSOTE
MTCGVVTYFFCKNNNTFWFWREGGDNVALLFICFKSVANMDFFRHMHFLSKFELKIFRAGTVEIEVCNLSVCICMS